MEDGVEGRDKTKEEKGENFKNSRIGKDDDVDDEDERKKKKEKATQKRKGEEE